MNEAIASLPCAGKEIKLTASDEARFWSKVDKAGPTMQHMESPCWLWTASKRRNGYGQFWAGSKLLASHRIAWMLSHGAIHHDGSHHGICALHRCDNPACVNPAHLFLGTNKDNVRDMTAKGRNNTPSGDRHGSRTKPECTARGSRHGSRLHPERVPRGEAHSNSKLTADKVQSIRRRSAEGEKGSALAQEYGVSNHVISGIILRKAWRHI